MVRLREEHNGLFALGLALAIGTAMLAPVAHGILAISSPWRPGGIEKYDLRPEASMLIALNVGHWATAAAGLLGVLLVLGAAMALPWYAGIPLSLLAFCLGVWNSIGVSSRMW